MTPTEFYLWLNGYLDALEVEGIEKCEISNIRAKMAEVKTRQQERIVFGPNVNPPTQQSTYAPNQPTARK